MSILRSTVGIDPSGNRLALIAVRTGLGGVLPAAPAAVSPLRGDRDAALMVEAEAALSDYVARHDLAGSPARLFIPARHVFTARVAFPPLKDRDIGEALALELERLFPLPAARLRYAWRKAADATADRKLRLIVAAVPSDYLARWEECVSRAGLVLVGAIPAGWALASACAKIGRVPAGPAALLRNAGGALECTVFSRGEPVFSAARPCAPEAMPALAVPVAEEGVPDTAVPAGAADEVSAEILAPAAWRDGMPLRGEGRIAWRVNGNFEEEARKVLCAGEAAADPWEVIGAFGAAAGSRTMDLVARNGSGARFPWSAAVAGVLGAATLLLAVAWPATVAWKTGAEARRLDARLASLQPAVAQVRDDLEQLRELEEKIGLLREAGAGRGEPIEILRLLTERLPAGTWLTGLRVEGRRVEIDGFSPAASEIFPLLTRDGRFRGVEFAAPVVRQGDNLERFQIRGEFVPAVAGGPGSGGTR